MSGAICTFFGGSHHILIQTSFIQAGNWTLSRSSLSLRASLADQSRLLSIASYERRRHNREEARNLLEGYLYRLQGLLNPESENKAMEEYAKPEERDALNKAMKEAFEWLADHAESAEEAVLRKKRTDIE